MSRRSYGERLATKLQKQIEYHLRDGKDSIPIKKLEYMLKHTVKDKNERRS